MRHRPTPAVAECDGHFDGYFGQPCLPPHDAGREAVRAYLAGFEQGRGDAERERAEVWRLRREWRGEDGVIVF